MLANLRHVQAAQIVQIALAVLIVQSVQKNQLLVHRINQSSKKLIRKQNDQHLNAKILVVEKQVELLHVEHLILVQPIVVTPLRQKLHVPMMAVPILNHVSMKNSIQLALKSAVRRQILALLTFVQSDQIVIAAMTHRHMPVMISKSTIKLTQMQL